jgi:excisionase family DNA binding protein
MTLPINAPHIMNPEEAAEYLRVTPQTVYRRLREGSLPGAKVGGQWRILKEDLDAYLKGKWKPE